MSVYMTEEEQLESIKKWWKNYGNSVLFLLSLILLSIAGYRYWHSYQDKRLDQASRAYEQLMIAFSNQNTKNIKAYANQLIDNYSHTVYADAAHLTLAKQHVNNGNLNKARDELQFVSRNSKMPALKQIAKIRLARVLLMTKNYDQATETLAVVADDAYLPLINELRGDIFASTGKYQQATEFYTLALEEAKKKGIGNLFLEMKNDEIAALATAIKGKQSA